jgi:hypothetical protein
MRYALYLVLSAVCLTTGALLTFDHISVSGVTVARVDSLAAPTADTLPSPEVATPAVPTAADYARFAKADSAWRQTYARQYTVAELRARGDGRRSARDSARSRLSLRRSGQRARAIAELEGWVGGHPRDGELLPLARLLAESGQNDASIRRYRQLLARNERSNDAIIQRRVEGPACRCRPDNRLDLTPTGAQRRDALQSKASTWAAARPPYAPSSHRY